VQLQYFSTIRQAHAAKAVPSSFLDVRSGLFFAEIMGHPNFTLVVCMRKARAIGAKHYLDSSQ